MSSRRGQILVAVLVAVAVTVVGCGWVWLGRGGPVRLNEEYYGDREVLDIGAAEYERLLGEKKSFVLMVDNAGCVTTERMRVMMEEFPEDMQFKYYRMMWPEARETSLREYVKYYPSLVVIEDGKVKYYLRADSDEDAVYYNDAGALQGWVRERVEFKNPAVD